jgi:5'-3' exonuclease
MSRIPDNPAVRWLVLDCNYLAHRAWHVLRGAGLEVNGEPTAILFGFLREVVRLQRDFNTDRTVFCFDMKPYVRAEAYPTYKHKVVRFASDLEKQSKVELRRQLDMLRKQYLTEIGFKNILCQPGYEADDMIALACQHSAHADIDEFVIVSADHDLYQLLSPRVSIWNPRYREQFTYDWFRTRYPLVMPEEWAEVKAVAGCPSDNIKGIQQAAELTAMQLIADQIPHSRAVYQRYVSPEGRAIIERNRELVRLPHARLKKECELKRDTIRFDTWRSFCKRMKLKTLENDYPVTTDNVRKKVMRSLDKRREQRATQG